MGWLSTLIDKLFIWVPRCELIRPTHGGVKWRARLFGKREPAIIELKPGLHWFWPLKSEIDVTVTARRPVDIPTMSLLSKDGVSVIVGAAVVFRVNDVVKAMGGKNWDVDSTLVDITQSVIFGAVRARTFDELLDPEGDLLDELSRLTRKELCKFGIFVERVLMKDFDRSKTYRMLGDAASFLESESDE
jgi:regulator of protease activity HflC (stomatin/prohibitin superfamily)